MYLFIHNFFFFKYRMSPFSKMWCNDANSKNQKQKEPKMAEIDYSREQYRTIFTSNSSINTFNDRLNPSQKIQEATFKHASKTFYKKNTSLEHNISYWTNHMTIDVLQWSKIIKKLGKIHNLNPSICNSLYELYTGVSIPSFYHPCPLCMGEGGSYHIFFVCGIAREMHEKIKITNINLNTFIGHDFENTKILEINKSIDFLKFIIIEFQRLRKNKIQITNTQKTRIIIKFKQNQTMLNHI